MRPLPRGAALASLALALAGCPLPQPVPAVQRTDGTTVTPPRIVVASALPATAVVAIRSSCDPAALLSFGADVEDLDLDDTVEARWFVDYTPQNSGVIVSEIVPAAADGVNPRRALRPFALSPALYAPGAPHVVEVVVSNGFEAGLAGALPNRTALPGFETQVFRWFVVVDDVNGVCE